MGKVSVIMPAYNCAAYIKDALNSILSQTLLPYEILVVDDGSTDNTAEVVKAINNPKIRYLKQENAGVSAARNYGLQHVSGDFIAFLDADDLWRPEMLARQYATLSQHPDIIFSFTNFIRFDDPASDYPFLPQFNFYPELRKIQCNATADTAVKIISGDAFCQLVNFGEVPAYTQAIMFKAEALKNLRFDSSLKVCEDAEFVLRCAAAGPVAFDETLLLDVRRHNSNATRDTSLIAVDKLASFLKLRDFPHLTPLQHNALLSRLTIAYWDAANAQLAEGQRKQSWLNVKKAWAQPDALFAKTKRSMRWLINVIRL